MKATCRMLTSVGTLIVWLALAQAVSAAPLILNGGFELGFTGWTRVDQLGSDGTFALQTGTTSPVNGDPVPAPPGGITAAMSDALGPGSHVLYQDFVVPTNVSATLLFSLFLGNRAGTFVTPSPATLDFSTPALNQQARVDILRGGTDAFSVAAADVLLNVFQTTAATVPAAGYTTFSVNLAALLAANAGNTLRLRFAETDNLAAFQLGVDNVSLESVPVPEPASLLLLGTGLAALGVRRRKRA